MLTVHSLRLQAVLAVLAGIWANVGASAMPSMPLPAPERAVTRSGALTAEIPIPAPPGAGGFQPDLRLRYSSHGGDGPFGIGWSLGLSEIRRSSRVRMPTFVDPWDEFELDGQRLIPGGGGRYFTMDESFHHITAESGAGAYTSWSVRSPAGITSRYGTTAGSVVASGGVAAAWLLSELEDPHGNRVCLFYNQSDAPAAAGDNYPYLDKVTYTHRGSCSGNAIGSGNRIQFEYEARPNDEYMTVYSVSVPLTLRLRATTILVYADNVLRRRISLSYAPNSAFTTNRTRLEMVTLEGCEEGASCAALPPATFEYLDAGVPQGSVWDEWQGGEPGESLPVLPHAIEEPQGSAKSRDLGWRVGDVDGNGLPDLIRAYEPEPPDVPDEETFAVYLNDGRSFEFSPSWSAALASIFFLSWDLAVVASSGNVQDVVPIGTVGRMYFATARDWKDPVGEDSQGNKIYRAPVNARLMDVNGDRRVDLVASYLAVDAAYSCNGGQACTKQEYTSEVWLNTGDHWAPDAQLSASVPPFESFFLREKPGGGIQFPTESTCVAGSSPCTAKLGWFPGGFQTADVNGDGALDLLASRCESCTPDAANLPEGAWLYGPAGYYLAPAFMPPVEHVGSNAQVDHNQVDTGVRYVDLNGDGYTDLVKTRVQDLTQGPFHVKGVWLSTGTAWVQDTSCPDGTSPYQPPTEFLTFNSPSGVKSRQIFFADLNADGLVDIARAGGGQVDAWIQSTRVSCSVWKSAPGRFEPPITVDGEVQVNFAEYHRSKGVVIGDFDGDGTIDFLKRYGNNNPVSHYAETFFSDRISSIQNGEGGFLDLTYESLVTQREDHTGGLESFANWYSAVAGESVSFPIGVIDEYWPTLPVVTAAVLSGPDPGTPTFSYAFAYGGSRWDPGLRIPYGNRVVRVTRPDESNEIRMVYQKHGRTGRLARLEIRDESGSVVRESGQTWEVVDGTATRGSGPGTFIGRLVSEVSKNRYGSGEGAVNSATYSYSHPGNDCPDRFNFACVVEIARPSGDQRIERKPDHDEAAWILGNPEWEKILDGEGSLRRHREQTYLRGLVATRRRFVTPALEGGAAQVDERFEYDQYGNLIERENGRGFSTYFCYDGGGTLPGGGACPAVTNGFALLAGIEEPDAASQRFVRDPMTGAIRSHTSFNGDVTATFYDFIGRVSEKRFTPSGSAEVTLEVRDHLDGAGSYSESFLEVGGGADAIRTAVYFDAYGRLAREVTPGGPGGWKGVAYAYDYAGRTLSETYPKACGDASCSTLTGATMPRTATVYDALGRPTSVTNADGATTSEYLSEARLQPAVSGPGTGGTFDVVAVSDPKGNLTRQLRDGDRTVFVDECTTAASSTACAGADITFYTFEPTGEPRAIYDAVAVSEANWSNGRHHTRFIYDTLGQQREIYDPDGGHRTSNYDANGNLSVAINARGQVITYAFDELDRPTLIDDDSTLDGDVAITYDDDGTWTRQRRTVTQGTKYSITYAYDSFGRLARETLATQGETLLTDFEYDHIGRITRVEDPSGLAAVYVYDGPRLTRVCRGIGSSCSTIDPDFVQSVSYTPLGRREVVEHPNSRIEYEYNAQHRVSSVDFYGESSAPLRLDYYYDTAGQLSFIVDTAQMSDGVNYAAWFDYDARQRLDRWKPSDGEWRGFDYDSLGNLTWRPTPSGAGTSFFFEDETRPRAISSVGSPEGAKFGYDDDGNRTEDPQSGHYFTYDASNRLVEVGTSKGQGDVAKHGYDVDGRRLFTITSTETRLFAGAYFEYNQTTDRSISFIFAFGELQATRSLAMTYLRTAGLLPPGWSLPAVPSWLLALLLAGVTGWLLVRLEVPGALRDRPVAGTLSLVVIAALTALPARGGVVAGGEALRYYASDLVGTALVVVDRYGNTMQRRQYEPYGLVWSESSGPSETTRKRYAGHNEDPATGLFDFSARWYDASTGSFLSTDPLISHLGDPQTHNAYAYARGNPVANVDPTGEFIVGLLSGLVSGFFNLFSGLNFDNWNFSFNIGFLGENGFSGLTLGFSPGRELFGGLSLGGVEVAHFSKPLSTPAVHTAAPALGEVGTSQGSYKPKGPGTVFESPQQAAIDGLFHGRQRSIAEGNPILERGGSVYPTGGGFTYDELAIQKPGTKGVEFERHERWVADFHTHTRQGNPALDRANEMPSREDFLNTDPDGRPSYILTPTDRVMMWRGRCLPAGCQVSRPRQVYP